jgi:hypothetical protein
VRIPFEVEDPLQEARYHHRHSIAETSPGPGWKWVGWIANPPSIGSYEDRKRSALRTGHGEERRVVDRKDGSGADCYYLEIGGLSFP